MLRVSISRLRAGLRAALEAFLQLLLVPRHLGRRLSADDERHQQLADPVSLEVEIDRHARTLSVLERLDRTLDHPPDGAIDTANGPAVRRIQLAHLHRHRPFAATNPAGRDDTRTHGNRAFVMTSPCVPRFYNCAQYVASLRFPQNRQVAGAVLPPTLPPALR